MPKVAQYGAPQVRSQVVAQPKAQSAPAAAFGAPIAEGVLDIAQAGIDIKQRVDTTSAEEALVRFERDKNDLFFNPDNGYFNTQGRNAYDNSASASQALGDLKTKYGDTLGQQAKLMFDGAADQHITRSQLDITKHASKGLKTWEAATLEAQVENSVENASLYWNDPDRLRVQSVVGEQAVIDAAGISGIGPEATAERLQTFRSSFARSTVEAATQSSAAEGKVALDEYGDRLEGPDKVKMEGAIERKAKVEKTQADAQSAVLTATRLVDQHENLSDVIEEVNKIEDSELRKKTMTEARTQYSLGQTAKKQEQNDNYQASIDQVNKGMTPAQIEASNPEAWLGMSDIQRNNILSGKHMITDQVLLHSLRSLPTKQKAQLNAVDYSDKLKPADLQKLTTEIESAKKGKPGSRVKALSTKAMEAAESAYGRKSKWASKGGNMSNKGKLANQFLSDVQDAIDEFEDEAGRKITPAEENQLLGEFTRGIVVERSALGFDILAADVEIDLSNSPPKDVRLLNRVIDNTPDVDMDDLTSAYQYLIDNNQPVTAGNLRSVYDQGRK